MKLFFFIITLCLSSTLSKAQYSELAFYVVAHQDDWQLFMGASAYKYVSNKNAKAVFIYTTAGDAGLIGDKGNGEGYGDCNNCTMPYFRSREMAAIASIQQINPPSKVAQWCECWPYPKMKEVAIKLNEKFWYVKRYSYCNTESYFLRIPEGGLKKIAEGKPVITVIENPEDHQNTFRNWEELTALLNAIITYEQGNLPSFWLNTDEPADSLNPLDHIDHRYTTKACIEATAGIKANFNFFLGYRSELLPDNLTADEVAMGSALMAAYIKSNIDAGWWDDWEITRKFYKKSYKREVLDTNTAIVKKPLQQKVEMFIVGEADSHPKKNSKENVLAYLSLFSMIIIWLRIIAGEYNLFYN